MATVHYLAGRLDAEIPSFSSFETRSELVSSNSFTAYARDTDYSPTFYVTGSGFKHYWGGDIGDGSIINSIEITGYKILDYSLAPPYLTKPLTFAPYLSIHGLDTYMGTFWGGRPYWLSGVEYYGFKAQLFRWLNGDDDVFGTVGNNLLRGYEGSNRYYASAGNDIVDGKYGFDTLVLDGTRAQYEIFASSADFENLDQPATAITDGVNTTLLVDVERIEFSNSSLAFDMEGEGSAGWAARLIGATWGKEAVADEALAGEMIKRVEEMGVETVTHLLISRGFVSNLAGGSDNTSFFAHLFKNVVGIAPTQAQLDHLVSFVDSGTYTQAQALRVIAGLDETANQIGLTGLAQSGWEYVEYTG